MRKQVLPVICAPPTGLVMAAAAGLGDVVTDKKELLAWVLLLLLFNAKAAKLLGYTYLHTIGCYGGKTRPSAKRNKLLKL